jgi:hypothetical protein
VTAVSEQLLRALNNLLGHLADPPPGKKINGTVGTRNPDGSLASIQFVDVNGAVLFTLNISWNPDGTWKSIIRS